MNTKRSVWIWTGSFAIVDIPGATGGTEKDAGGLGGGETWLSTVLWSYGRKRLHRRTVLNRIIWCLQENAGVRCSACWSIWASYSQMTPKKNFPNYTFKKYSPKIDGVGYKWISIWATWQFLPPTVGTGEFIQSVFFSLVPPREKERCVDRRRAEGRGGREGGSAARPSPRAGRKLMDPHRL